MTRDDYVIDVFLLLYVCVGVCRLKINYIRLCHLLTRSREERIWRRIKPSTNLLRSLFGPNGRPSMARGERGYWVINLG